LILQTVSGAGKKTGTAFDNQPNFGDNPTARGKGPAKQQGDWWIGGAEIRSSPHDPAGPKSMGRCYRNPHIPVLRYNGQEHLVSHWWWRLH